MILQVPLKFWSKHVLAATHLDDLMWMWYCSMFFVKKKRTVWDLGLRRQNLEHAHGAGREMSEDLQSLSETNEVVGKLENLWLVVSNIFYSHPYLGKWSNLTDIFQMGWNHQLVLFWEVGWDSPIYTLVFQSYLLRFGVWSVCFWGS